MGSIINNTSKSTSFWGNRSRSVHPFLHKSPFNQPPKSYTMLFNRPDGLVGGNRPDTPKVPLPMTAFALPSNTWFPGSTSACPKLQLHYFSRSLHSRWQRVTTLYNGPPLHPSKLPFCMVHWAHQSPQPKRHLDQFRRFCRAH